MSSNPHSRFAALAQRPDRELDLAEGALLISAVENPNLEPEPHLELLDRWGREAACRIHGAQGELERLQALSSFLFEDKGLAGNGEDYYDPRNSFLDQVLERRLGIPITLGIVTLEVGRRARVPLVGVGFPGHFLLRHARHPQVLLDPFDGGQLLTRYDCAHLLDRLTRGRIPFSRRLLAPVGPREILVRMLNNLSGIFLGRGEVGRALEMVEHKILLLPGEAVFRRDRGLLRLKLGDGGGMEDLQSYLEAEPDAADWNQIAEIVEGCHSGRGDGCGGSVH